MDGFRTYLRGQMEGMADSSTVVVLHDAFGSPAAADLESKLVEAAVCNVQVADCRSFAHGRHNWLDKHGKDTGVIMLSNHECDFVASRTAELLPREVPVAALRTNIRGAGGHAVFAGAVDVRCRRAVRDARNRPRAAPGGGIWQKVVRDGAACVRRAAVSPLKGAPRPTSYGM